MEIVIVIDCVVIEIVMEIEIVIVINWIVIEINNKTVCIGY